MGAVASLAHVQARSDSGIAEISPLAETCEIASRFMPYPLFSLFTGPEVLNSGCFFFNHDGVRYETFLRRGPQGRYRVHYAKRSGAEPAHFIIYLTGGPRGYVAFQPGRSFADDPVVALAKLPRTAVLAPEYLGTVNRTLYPGSDLGPAADEVVDLFRALRRLHPGARISVLGFSAGGWVALEALRRETMSVILFAPLSLSGREFLARPAGTDMPPDAASTVVRFWRQRQGARAELVEATAAEQLTAFLGDAADDDLGDFIDRIPRERHRCISVLYGADDRRINVGALARLQPRYPSLRFQSFPGFGHGPVSVEETNRFAGWIEAASRLGCPSP